MPTVDDEIRSLYAGPLEQFVATRQALVKSLKKAGDARATEVGSLRKPAPSAWAVNRLLALEPQAMAKLFSAGETARGAQAKLLAGGDREVGGVVRTALETVRGEVARLAALVLGWMTSAAAPPGPAVGERLRQNLEALALDPAHAAVVARGWLDVDLPPPGFEILAGLQIAADASRPMDRSSSGVAGETARATVDRPAVRDGQAKREARERERQLEAARAELARLEGLAAEARRAAEVSKEAVDRARREVVEAEQRAFQVRREAAEDEKRAQAAAADVERARSTLRRLESPR